MGKKKMSKQDKKRAEAEQAEALRIEMEKQRFPRIVDCVRVSLHSLRHRFRFAGKSSWNSSESE